MKISTWHANLPANATSVYDKIVNEISKTDEIVGSKMDADAALIWSVLWHGRMARSQNVWNQYRSRNLPVIVAEVGGLVRNKTWRLSANGINRSAIFPNIKNLDLDRPKKLELELKPWHTGEYILICGQHGRSQQWANMLPMEKYYQTTVLEIRKYTNRPIVIRSHPRFRENLFFPVDQSFYKDLNVQWNMPHKIHKTYDSFDLEVLLPHCHCVVSHSSNSGVAAILAGTPAIVSEESLAFPVATNDFSKIESLPQPNREEWLIDISHREWFVDELDIAWKGLRHALYG